MTAAAAVGSIVGGVLREALQEREPFWLSQDDSLIAAAAVEAECAVLYSDDLQHGLRIEGVQVVNPFVWVRCGCLRV